MKSKQVEDVIREHLFETEEQMKINIANDLNISQDNIKFWEYTDRTEIEIFKDGTGQCFVIKVNDVPQEDLCLTGIYWKQDANERVQ